MQHPPLPDRLLLARLAVLATASLLPAQGPNLIQNPSFETGSLAPWTLVAGSVAVAPYGSASLPGTAVANATGGGGLMLRDQNSGIVEQVLTPAIPPGASLVLESFLGGGGNDWTRLVVIARDGAGNQLTQQATDFVTERQRNQETVHLFRRLVLPVPPLTASFVVRIEFANQCCGAATASADQISARLVTGSTLPAALPLGAELLGNPGFENGWTAGSPLGLLAGGWEGAGTNATPVLSYSNSSGSVPNGIVSCIIDGAAPNPSCVGGAAGNLLGHTGGDSAVVQTIDARGSTASFPGGGTSLRYGAHLGGIGDQADATRLEVRFRNGNGTTLQSGQLGPVGAAERNYESLLVRRERDIVVPAGTEFIDVIAVFSDLCCGGAFALIDNVSARLVPTAPTAPVPLGTNLLPSASFENGSLPGSPLELNATRGWFGAGSGRMTVPQYGAPSMPSSAFALQNGLGNLLLQDGTNSVLRVDVDLRGSALAIANGLLAMQASAWLGGQGGQADTAEVRIRFQTIAGVPTGAVTILPPVTAAERQNQTRLIQRLSAPFAVPTNAATAIVEVVFTDTCCGGAFALADDVRLVAFSTAQQTSANPYPGTDPSALMLATGVDELPRNGLGATVKPAQAGRVLRTQVGSPSSALDGAPVVLALDLFQTGQPRGLFLPDLWIDPRDSLLIYNGLFGGVLPPVVVPMAQGGNPWSQTIPPSLQGISLLLQAVALPVNGPVSPNGLWFATDAHEIRVQ